MGTRKMAYSGDDGIDSVGSAWFRMLGILPVIFFLARLVEYVQVGTPSQVLWMCHLANLMLAAGLFAGREGLTRVSALLIVFGLPPWVVDMFVIRIVTPVSIASHLGGVVLALLVIARVRMRRGTWLPALLTFLAVQQLCRMFTPRELDINNAHKVYSIWSGMISNYWLYWVPSVLVVGTGMWIIEIVLVWFFPKEEAAGKAGSA